MATLPVESMQTGGMLWFTDLTFHDPYYVLPVAVSLTMLATIEVGVITTNFCLEPLRAWLYFHYRYKFNFSGLIFDIFFWFILYPH